jgi:hypothetical protein
MATPRDQQLYRRVKKRIQQKYTTWSAYASGHLVQQYKKAFKQKYGANASPYIGKKSTKAPLATWFKENWVNVTTGRPCGAARSKGHYPTCRPKDTYAKMSKKKRQKMHDIKQLYGTKTASYRSLWKV